MSVRSEEIDEEEGVLGAGGGEDIHELHERWGGIDDS